MLISKFVRTRWTSRMKNYYESKGYPFTNRNDEFLVKVEDLTDGSFVEVLVQCDCPKCSDTTIKSIKYARYKKNLKEDGKYYCQKCIDNELKRNISFYDWCYQNLSKEEADEIMKRWDYELNIDKEGNKISPKDISRGSDGFDRKGYWFKCLEHPEHGSELKSIVAFTYGKYKRLDCIQCNTISITNPELISFLINKEDVFKYSRCSSKLIPMKCPNCGYEREFSFQQLIDKGFACPKCSEGYYPEKFMFNFLEQLLDNDFQTQLSRKTFKWCENYRYDNYLEKTNCIIETHGKQHYEKLANGSKWKGSLKEIQDNDKIKEQLAKDNGIKNYIVLDCRHSELEWIKNSIMQSDLPKLLNFKEEDINWLKCHESAISSRAITICDLWNNGIKNIKIIANRLKLNIGTVKKYLRQGAMIGWCDYIHSDKVDYTLKYKRVICLTTNIIFDSIKDASKMYEVLSTSIVACCKGRVKSAGKYLVTGEKLKWMYYEDYLNKI